MFKNYLKTAWRSFLRQKVYSILNIVGLSIGLTCCIVILLFVNYELSYDKLHSKSNRIFRVVQELEGQDWAWTGGATRHIVQDEFKEVEHAASLVRITTHVTSQKDNGKVTFREERFFFADPDFLKIFDFELIHGDPGNTLTEPFKVLISESMATKYFGSEDAIGKTIELTGNNPFEVTGILRDTPENSHLQFDFLSGMVSFKITQNYPATSEFTSHWWPSAWTYVLLDDPISANPINQNFPEVMKKHRNPEEVDRFRPHLQPIEDIHLHSEMSGEIGQNGSIRTVYIFLAVAVFTLLLACINFMNLATARAVKRAREIGVRKVNGAIRRQLVSQFFFESFMMNMAAFLLAILLADLLLPLFSVQVERQLTIELFASPAIWVSLLGVVLLSGFMSGFYPALYLSGFKPVTVLKSNMFRQGGADLRKALVVFQFTLSVSLIFCTSVAYLQIQYFRDADLGFDKEHVVVLNSGYIAGPRYDAIRNELMTYSSVEEVTAVSNKPGIQRGWGPTLEYQGSNPNERLWMFNQQVDYNFFQMLEIPIISGRVFSKEFHDEGKGTMMRERFPAYTDRNFIVNESAVKFLGRTNESVLGMELRLYTEENGLLFSDVRGVVIGVIKDFNTANLKNEMVPTCFSPVRTEFGNNANYFLVKLQPGKFSDAEKQLREAWAKIVPEVPLEFSFLDEDIEQQYLNEKRLGNVVGMFAIIALFISCLGLFGLSAYTVETRTKEIGIRKAMGASETKIVGLLSRDFLQLVIMGVLIALPVGWWAMTRWLDQFAFRISLSPLIFVWAGAVAILIAMITVSFQSLRAAHLNPVKSLRSE